MAKTGKLLIAVTAAQLDALREACGFRAAGDTSELSAADYRALCNAQQALYNVTPERVTKQPPAALTPLEAHALVLAADNTMCDDTKTVREFFVTRSMYDAAYRAKEKLSPLVRAYCVRSLKRRAGR